MRFYGFSLDDVDAGVVSPVTAANAAAYLPRGSAVSEWFGGWGAVSETVEHLMRVETLLHAQMVQASGKRRKVPEPEPPAGVRDVKRKSDRAVSMADKWRRKYGGA